MFSADFVLFPLKWEMKLNVVTDVTALWLINPHGEACPSMNDEVPTKSYCI